MVANKARTCGKPWMLRTKGTRTIWKARGYAGIEHKNRHSAHAYARRCRRTGRWQTGHSPTVSCSGIYIRTHESRPIILPQLQVPTLLSKVFSSLIYRSQAQPSLSPSRPVSHSCCTPAHPNFTVSAPIFVVLNSYNVPSAISISVCISYIRST